MAKREGSATHERRLAGALEGFPAGLIPEAASEQLTRFVLDLDAIGRLDRSSDRPLADEHTLHRLLAELASPDLAQTLVECLQVLPSPAFRSTGLEDGIPDEAGWFDLAEQVVIFDAEPGSQLAELGLSVNMDAEEVMNLVRKRFPGLELDLLDPDNLPARIQQATTEESWPALLAGTSRQLGWWSALIAVLLTVPAQIVTASPKAKDFDQRAATWPLAMYLMGVAVGDWTMTVVCSCVMAPTEVGASL